MYDRRSLAPGASHSICTADVTVRTVRIRPGRRTRMYGWTDLQSTEGYVRRRLRAVLSAANKKDNKTPFLPSDGNKEILLSYRLLEKMPV